MCHMLCDTCHMPLRATATAIDPTPARDSRIVFEDPKIIFLAEQFYTISDSQSQILRRLYFYLYSVRNMLVIDHFDLRPLQMGAIVFKKTNTHDGRK